MSLSTGETLGPYEILARIGAGGMGEVYRARDTRLGREVAIKVSAEQFNERFEREAKAIASLNHHNICSLFDVGPNFLVMELVEGATLAERIAEGPIPVEEALHIAAQIAEALQAAHDSGIVHRDLKPSNIKIRPDGTVKVLDFGLAKMGSGTDSAAAARADSPTLSLAATQAGMILGTAAYMSPEQARGKPVDKRADIWAFGAVLYEMVTGRQLFRGEDVSEVLASVIMQEPDFDPIPTKVRQVLKRCLEKDPKKRLRDISGVALLLEHESAIVSTAHQPSPKTFWLWPASVLAALIIAAVMGFGWYRTRPAPPALKPLMRLNVDIGPKADFTSSALTGTNVMLSPDGDRLAYIAQSHLYVQRGDQAVPTEIVGTDGVYSAFFSPDGRWLGFFAGGKMKKVSVDGGAIVTLCDAAIARGGAWGDGIIIASLASTGGIMRIPEGGGMPVALTQLQSGEATHRWPQIVPGGKAFVYTAHTGTSGFDTAVIKLFSFVDGKTKVIQEGGTFGRVVKTRSGNAYLLFLSRDTLFARPFDLDRMEATASAVPMLDGFGTSTTGSADFDVTNDGTAVYRTASGTGLTLQWVNAAGKVEPLITKPAIYGRPALSPQGDRVAIEVATSTSSDIWIYDPKRDNTSRLTFGNGTNVAPLWSPDGRYIVYQEVGGMAWIRSDGGAQQSLTKSKNLQFPWSFSPDGKHLAFMETGKGGYDLWILPIEGDVTSGIRAGKPEVFVNSEADERSPTFSPDGHWIAYHANEGGAFEVYVRAYPDTGRKWQVSDGGGTYPMWSKSAHELIFETLDAHIMSASYSVTNDSFVPEKPQVWSSKPIVNSINSVKNFDLAPDGKRIAALMPAETSQTAGTQSHVTFLLNFFDELERRVPVKK
jgi:serine/threonine-protein kinase